MIKIIKIMIFDRVWWVIADDDLAIVNNPFPKPDENDALNSGRPHRFGLV